MCGVSCSDGGAEVLQDPAQLPPGAGVLIRGEDGLIDWYCKTPSDATWGYLEESELRHFEEMLAWQYKLMETFHELDESSGLTAEEMRRLQQVNIQVMIHFREGVESPEF